MGPFYSHESLQGGHLSQLFSGRAVAPGKRTDPLLASEMAGAGHEPREPPDAGKNQAADPPEGLQKEAS